MNIGMKIGANIAYLALIDPTNMLNTTVSRMKQTTSSHAGIAALPSA